MNMRFPRFDFLFSQSSDTLKVVKDISLAVGTGFLGYLSNFLVNAVNPHFFDSLLGTILLALSIPLVIVLLYQQQRATPWSGLLIGFVVGIFQSFHFNWFQDHTDENMFKIALILLALMLLLVP
ncbi:MAG TPA: hypothetical protein VGU68_21265, partial [Ktedonobacteraceae bacterium]|nr:hypothetical protein [Ktedonobacteraceae bacterium]